MNRDYIKQGDCLTLMQELPDSSIDMILCDLPYGTTKCKWDSVIPFSPLWEQYKRILRKDGSIVLFGTEPFTSNLICSNLRMFKEKLIWEKHKPSNIGCAKIMHLKYTEDIVVFAFGKHTFNPQRMQRVSRRVEQAQKGNSKQWRTSRFDNQEVSFNTQYAAREWSTFDANTKFQGNVLRFPAVVSNSKEKTPHPTQKPVKLLEYLIQVYSNEGGVILDTCIGSGSTAIAAIRTGRHFIGYEITEEYYNIAVQRIKTEMATPSLFNDIQ